MSLITDKVFFNALCSSSELMDMTDGRIENTTFPVPDHELLNVPVPYIIVTFDGLQNEGYTKDNNFEGHNDKVQVSIEVAAENRDQLAELMPKVRQVIIDYFENTTDHATDDYALVPTNYVLTAGPIAYDSVKPCFYQILTYNCDTNP